MDSENFHIDLFDRYISGSLKNPEKSVFEERLQKDDLFKKEFSEFINLVTGIQIQAASELKKRLIARESALNARKKGMSISPVYRYIAGIAAAVVILIIAGYPIWNRTTERNISLFNKYFKPYPNIVNPVSRAGNDNEKQVWVLYEQGRFRKAYKLFEVMTRTNEDPSAAHFYSGICLLGIQKPGGATREFNRVLSSGNSRFNSPSKWYCALAYLQNGQQRHAKKLLKEIITDKGDFSVQAEKLMDEL